MFIRSVLSDPFLAETVVWSQIHLLANANKSLLNQTEGLGVMYEEALRKKAFYLIHNKIDHAWMELKDSCHPAQIGQRAEENLKGCCLAAG